MKTTLFRGLLVSALFGMAGCGSSNPPGPKWVQGAQPSRPQAPVEAPAQALAKAAPEDVQLDENLTRRNIYLVFDASGSMGDTCKESGRESKIVVAKRALANFIGMVPDEDNVGLLVFDGRGASERAPLKSGNRRAITQVVNATSPGDGTPLRAAISIAYKKLQQQMKRQLGYGQYFLVGVTDGEASEGQDPREVVNKITRESPVIVYTIGFGIGSNHSLNQPGKTVYREANNPTDLETGLKGVLAEAEQFVPTSFK